MPTNTDDPTKKYSDQGLDPSHSAFDEIVNRPDMKALGDQNEAYARDQEASKLKQAETTVNNQGQGAQRSIKEAESKPDNGIYSPNDKKPVKISGKSAKKTSIKTAAALVTIAVAFLSFGLLLPLKIPGIMQMIADEAGQRIEQITEKRSKLLIGRYILNKALPNRYVITGEGAVSSLMASMRTARFERKLEAKGITFDGSGDGVTIRVNGEQLENGKVLKSDVEVLRALDGKPASRKIINELVKEEIPSWRWMKRAKFAKWLRLKYNIPRYGVENNDNPDEEERVKEMQESRLRPEYGGLASDMGSATECFVGTECDVDTQGDGRPADLASSGDSSSIGNDAEGAIDETIEHNIEAGQSGQKTLVKTVVDKLATKAIPIIGWIDLVATIDHLAWNSINDDYFGKIAAYYRAQQYARHYGLWSGYGSQIQLGAMDPEFIRVLAEQTEGVEEAQAFNYIQGNPERGEPVDKINSNSPGSYASDLHEINAALGGNSFGREVVHQILNAYYQTIGGGGLLGWVSDKLGDFFAQITQWLTPASFEEWFGKLVQKIGEKLFAIMGLDFDPLVKGPGWMNAAHGGATWTYNDFCKNEMGCRKLSPDQTAMQNTMIAAERSQYIQQKGLAYALFSTETSHSLLSQMAISSPTSIYSATSKVGKIIANIPATAVGLFSKKTSASAYVDIHGVDPYGALSEELNATIDQTAIDGGDCGESFDGEKLNLCQTDTMVAEAMICEFKPESEGCSDSSDSGDSGVCVGTSGLPDWTGFPTAIDAPIGGSVTGTVDTAVANIKLGSGVAPSLRTLTRDRPDFITVNEISETSVGGLENAAPGYGAYRDPTPNDNPDGNHLGNAIMWRKDKWSLVTGGRVKLVNNDQAIFKGREVVWDRFAAWAVFKRNDGAIVPVISTHMMTNPEKFPRQHGNPEMTRIEQYQMGMEILLQLVATLSKHGPVLVGGDFNSHANQGSWSAVPMMRSAGYGYAHDGAVMYQFHPRGTEVLNHHNVRIQSDHPAVRATIDMKGVGPDEVEVEGGIGECENIGVINIASFNILHAGPDPFEQQWRSRLPTSINHLKENDISVAGLQEVRPPQHHLIKTAPYSSGTYDIYPQISEGRGFSPNPVIWNKQMFNLVRGKTLPIEYDNGHTINHGVLVKLEDTRGNQFYVLNTHDPANVRPGSEAVNEKSRLDNANFYVRTLSELKEEGVPLFLTGDFNNSYTLGGNQQPYGGHAANLTYCVVSRSGFMKNVWDIAENKQFNCPRGNTPGSPPAPIDHIYAGNVDGVKRAWTAPDRSNGSDHPTMMASVTMPWADQDARGGGRAGNWSWPVEKRWWQSNKSDFLDSHPTYSGTFTSPYARGVAADISVPPDGSKVYAMLGGKVIKTNLCGAGDGMIIESSTPAGKVQIAYGHGVNRQYQVGQQVESGKWILNIGAVGCQVTGGHLHIDMVLNPGPNAKHVCPQDVFLAMGAGREPNLQELTGRARSPCNR